MNQEELSYHAVMYTDGSCLPPRGAYGGGCHGYLYTKDSYKKNGDKPNNYTVTDVGYLEKHELILDTAAMAKASADTKPTARPAIFQDGVRELKPELYYNAVYPYGRDGTNNQSELLAVIDTIRILANDHSVASILFCTDSMYVINVYNAVSKDPKSRSWLGDERPNMSLWVMLADVLLANSNIKITLKKVIAHGTAVGNNVADRLAYAAREMGGKGITTEKHMYYTGRYWKAKPTPHPMLNFKQVYFNVGVTANTDEHMYVVMDYPTNVELGKKSSEPLFGISIFNNPVTEIESVINRYISHCKGKRFLTNIDLRVLYTQNHSVMTQLMGGDAYSYKRNRLSLLDEDLLVTPITPPGLAQNALSKTMAMYKLYTQHRNRNSDTSGIVTRINITNQLYDVNEKGKLVFKYGVDVVGPRTVFMLNDKEITMDLVYGKDTLTRNQLKKLESGNTKVSLILHKCSETMYEYYNLIETDEATGIYGNYYINKLYI